MARSSGDASLCVGDANALAGHTADGDGVPVREVAKGDEVNELAEDERTWNAVDAEDGKLRLRSASARRKSSAKRA